MMFRAPFSFRAAQLRAPTDEALIERVDHADALAFEVIFDRHGGALGRLPTEQRRVIELAYFGGFTHSEIANMLELPAGTVKGRMRLGLIKLRLSLGDLATAAGGVR